MFIAIFLYLVDAKSTEQVTLNVQIDEYSYFRRQKDPTYNHISPTTRFSAQGLLTVAIHCPPSRRTVGASDVRLFFNPVFDTT